MHQLLNKSGSLSFWHGKPKHWSSWQRQFQPWSIQSPATSQNPPQQSLPAPQLSTHHRWHPTINLAIMYTRWWNMELLYTRKRAWSGCLWMFVPVMYNTHFTPSFLMYMTSIFHVYRITRFMVVNNIMKKDPPPKYNSGIQRSSQHIKMPIMTNHKQAIGKCMTSSNSFALSNRTPKTPWNWPKLAHITAWVFSMVMMLLSGNTLKNKSYCYYYPFSSLSTPYDCSSITTSNTPAILGNP